MNTSGRQKLLSENPCVCCGRSDHGTIDHKISRGLFQGSNTMDNLQVLCSRCNAIKSKLENKIHLLLICKVITYNEATYQIKKVFRRFCADRGHGVNLKCNCGDCNRKGKGKQRKVKQKSSRDCNERSRSKPKKIRRKNKKMKNTKKKKRK